LQFVKDNTCNHYHEETKSKINTDNGIQENPDDITNVFNNHYINLTSVLSNKYCDGKKLLCC